MTTTPKVLFRGAASTTTSTTLYTVPTLTTSIVTNIIVTNADSSARTFTISLDDVKIHESTNIDANSSVYIDLKQVLEDGDTIKGGASSANVSFHISGVEIV
jgi:hypothetical protein